MFQTITTWNFIRLESDLEKVESDVQLRGYNRDTFLTGRFSTKIANREIEPLSVSDIADILCPSRRDLYFKKGKNRGAVKSRKTWGRVGGQAVQNFAFTLFKKCRGMKSIRSYQEVIREIDIVSKDFGRENLRILRDLDGLKRRPDEDPYWLLKLLTYNGRAELGLRLLHTLLSRGDNREMNIEDLEITIDGIKPNPVQIGINRPAKPDFIVEKHKVVGDIKTGIGGFKDHYLLTCAGYALAYENERGEDSNIDFGIIYFFPTRYSVHAKPISLGQVYIFPIDDDLRDWFLKTRDRAYDTVSDDSFPVFPGDKTHCPYCQFIDSCVSEGLEL